MPAKLTFGSLFAGIGGFDLGFERAGLACRWQVEKDDFCLAVLEKHWPKVPKYKDVRECGRKNLEAVDVICGGFPCQPHSIAGKQAGAEDDRDLWPEFKRIIAELRPRWVVAENVPGIRTTILDQVLSDLEGLGYAWETAIIPACAFDARHKRDRVWIVGYAEHDGQTAAKIKGGTTARGNGNAAGARQASESEGSGEQLHTVADTKGHEIRPGLRQGEQREKRQGRLSNSGGTPREWPPEPGVGRVAHGVPDRVDRLKSLGNAAVPQVTEFIARLIVEVEKDE